VKSAVAANVIEKESMVKTTTGKFSAESIKAFEMKLSQCRATPAVFMAMKQAMLGSDFGSLDPPPPLTPSKRRREETSSGVSSNHNNVPSIPAKARKHPISQTSLPLPEDAPQGSYKARVLKLPNTGVAIMEFIAQLPIGVGKLEHGIVP
jgi:hypothetical protein